MACLITYLVCSSPKPFVHYCACFFLLYELSTPFMHVRQFCIMLKKTDTLVFKLANALFPLTFFAFRLVAGLAFSYDWAYRQWTFLTSDPRRDTASTAICCYLYAAVRSQQSLPLSLQLTLTMTTGHTEHAHRFPHLSRYYPFSPVLSRRDADTASSLYARRIAY